MNSRHFCYAIIAAMCFGRSVSAEELEIGAEIVSFEAPAEEGCPSLEVFQEEVRRLLLRDPFIGSQQDDTLRLSIVLRSHNNQFVGTLGPAGGPQKSARHFTAPSCKELAATIALAIVIAIDPFHIPAPAPEPTPDPSSVPTPDPSSVPTPDPSLVPTPDPSLNSDPEPILNPAGDLSPPVSWGWSASIQPSATVGAAPKTVASLAFGIEVRRDNTSLQLRLRGTSRGRESFEMGALDVRLLSMGASICLRFGRFSPCASTTFGVLRARGLAPLSSRQVVHQFYAATGVRGYLHLFELGNVQFHWFVDGQLAVVKTNLTVEDDVTWTTPSTLLTSGLYSGFNF